MNSRKRKELAAIFTRWIPFFIYTCIFIGSVLGSFLYYLFQDEFPYEVIVGGLLALIILSIIEVIKQKRKKDNLPEADERM
ncbi:hypothetical protein [Gracilibacillus dipsosauri]|uniref:Uncharacterized protein n=1 Tax=Gracilibacillus dipsosauri TaxID=178340 RepID=A0A317L0D6_9BACI|nr:hypothetical protein [Gracilibacillus dipsosauri]PWU69075.1 hypothetical protein DLJ74_11740 [Gracilibacillus dipsosauri]